MLDPQLGFSSRKSLAHDPLPVEEADRVKLALEEFKKDGNWNRCAIFIIATFSLQIILFFYFTVQVLQRAPDGVCPENPEAGDGPEVPRGVETACKYCRHVQILPILTRLHLHRFSDTFPS